MAKTAPFFGAVEHRPALKGIVPLDVIIPPSAAQRLRGLPDLTIRLDQILALRRQATGGAGRGNTGIANAEGAYYAIILQLAVRGTVFHLWPTNQSNTPRNASFPVA